MPAKAGIDIDLSMPVNAGNRTFAVLPSKGTVHAFSLRGFPRSRERRVGFHGSGALVTPVTAHTDPKLVPPANGDVDTHLVLPANGGIDAHLVLPANAGIDVSKNVNANGPAPSWVAGAGHRPPACGKLAGLVPLPAPNSAFFSSCRKSSRKSRKRSGLNSGR